MRGRKGEGGCQTQSLPAQRTARLAGLEGMSLAVLGPGGQRRGTPHHRLRVLYVRPGLGAVRLKAIPERAT